MKTVNKALKTLRNNVVKSEGWNMITHKKELLSDVPQEELMNMIITLSDTLTDLSFEISELEIYTEIKIKYGSE